LGIYNSAKAANFLPIVFTKARICGLDINGRIEHFTGAMNGLNLKKVLFSSLMWKDYSRSAYTTLPNPKAGSIIDGINFSSTTLTVEILNSEKVRKIK
jgi:hypothetical protein